MEALAALRPLNHVAVAVGKEERVDDAGGNLAVDVASDPAAGLHGNRTLTRRAVEAAPVSTSRRGQTLRGDQEGYAESRPQMRQARHVGEQGPYSHARARPESPFLGVSPIDSASVRAGQRERESGSAIFSFIL